MAIKGTSSSRQNGNFPFSILVAPWFGKQSSFIKEKIRTKIVTGIWVTRKGGVGMGRDQSFNFCVSTPDLNFSEQSFDWSSLGNV